MTLRLGIIGAGKAGRRHAEAAASLPGVEVAWIIDPDEAAAQRLAADHQARWGADHTALGPGEIDAAIICVPHHLLAPVARWAADVGVHTLLEKPMALSLAEADDLIAAFRRAGRVLTIGFVHRFRAEVRTARALIASGAIGEPVLAVDTKYAGRGNIPAWVWHRRTGGGVLLYNGIHSIDRLLWLVGREVEGVSAAGGRLVHPDAVDVEDTLSGTLRFAGGTVGTLIEHLTHYPLDGVWETRVFGTRGAVVIRTGESLTHWGGHSAVTCSVEHDDRFAAQMAAFAAAAAGRAEPAVTGEDGRRSLAVALALLEQAGCTGGGDPA